MSFENIPEFLQPIYWLTTKPASVAGTSGRIVFTVFLALFIAGIIVRVLSSKQVEKYKTIAMTRLANLLVTMGLLGAVLYFFSYERIQFFGGRFWYPIWILGFVVWGGMLLYYVKKQVPKIREEAILRKEKTKYLPKRKPKKRKR